MTSVVDAPRAAPRRPNGRVVARQARGSRRAQSKHRQAVTRGVITYVLLIAGGLILTNPVRVADQHQPQTAYRGLRVPDQVDT